MRCINIAINRYCVKGSFTRAARRKKDLAELFEAQPGERANAVESYETAARWYDRENQPGYVFPDLNLYARLCPCVVRPGENIC